MALKYPVTTMSGAERVAILNLPESGKEPFDIPGYDLRAELSFNALGARPSEALWLFYEWEKGLDLFLMSEDNLKRFLKQIHKQGLGSLGLDKKTFGKALSDTAANLIEGKEARNLVDREDFFTTVKKEYPNYNNLEWKDTVIEIIAEQAFDNSEFDLFAILDGLSKTGLYELSVENCKCESHEATSATCRVDVQFSVLGEIKDNFEITASVAYRDAELETLEWEDETSENVGGPKTETEEVLDAVGEVSYWEEFAEEHCTPSLFDILPALKDEDS